MGLNRTERGDWRPDPPATGSRGFPGSARWSDLGLVPGPGAPGGGVRRQKAWELELRTNGQMGMAPTCHVETRALQGRSCANCGAMLTIRPSGRPQAFCRGGCREAFWREARRLGGQVLRRRRALEKAREARPVTRPVPLTREALEKVRVILQTPAEIHLSCTACGTQWSPSLLASGRLPAGYWRCPMGCNKSKQGGEAGQGQAGS